MYICHCSDILLILFQHMLFMPFFPRHDTLCMRVVRAIFFSFQKTKHFDLDLKKRMKFISLSMAKLCEVQHRVCNQFDQYQDIEYDRFRHLK